MKTIDLIEQTPTDLSWANVEGVFQTLARALQSGVVPATSYVKNSSFASLEGTPLSESEKDAAFIALTKVVRTWIDRVRIEERTRLPYLDPDIHELAKRFGRYLSGKTYHAFLSHAREDKDEFVKPLVDALVKRGYKIWYDEFEIEPGMSIRRSIDQGLGNSYYGIVVLSPYFLRKGWTQWELDGLLARQVDEGQYIIPIWHRITKDELMKYSPSLVDKKALVSSLFTADELAQQLSKIFDR